jgi:hypothetical protein
MTVGQGPKPEPAAPPAAQPTTKPADDRRNSEEYWQHRERVLEGMIPGAVEKATKPLQERIQQLTEQLEQAQSQIPEPEPSINLAELYGEDMLEEFGEDHLKRIAIASVKMARNEAKQQAAAQVQPLADQVAATQETSQKNREAAYFAALTDACPGWRDVNESVEWRRWLAQPDPSTGYQRQQLLDYYRERQDVERTAGLFDAFHRDQAAITPESPPQYPQGRAAGATPGEPAAVASVSNAEVRAFYKQKAFAEAGRGIYANRPDKLKEDEARIEAAVAAGAVTP